MRFILFPRCGYALWVLSVPSHIMLRAWRHSHRRVPVPAFHSSIRSPKANSAGRRNRSRNSSTMSRGNLAAMHHLRQFHTVPHGGQLLAALAEGADAQRLDSKISLRTSSALRNRIAEPGSDVAFVFQAIECPVQRADGQRSLGSFLNFLAYRHAICIFTQPKNGQQYDLLKFPEMFARRHLCSA